MDNKNRYPHKNYSRKTKMQIVTTNVIQGKAHDNGDHITNKIPDFHSNHNIGNHVQISQQTFILSLSE